MKPRIAIPLPTSGDLEYNRANYAAYTEAVRQAGGEPVEVALDLTPQALGLLAASCQGVLLPGSPADVAPAGYGQETDPATAPSDPLREATDRALLENAERSRKPVLGICFGVQILNVVHGGTLVQDLTVLPVNHGAGRSVAIAHAAQIPGESVLGGLVDREEAVQETDGYRLPINSSHHQAVGVLGAGLRVVARCPQDGVVEAVEGTEAGRLVLGVQWHPERSTASSATSRQLFRRLVDEAMGVCLR